MNVDLGHGLTARLLTRGGQPAERPEAVCIVLVYRDGALVQKFYRTHQRFELVEKAFRARGARLREITPESIEKLFRKKAGNQ